VKFLVDESADARLAIHLRSLGHDAATVAGDYSPALKDPDVLAIAQHEQRVLITNDRDFGELVFRQRLPTSE
jgi:predicted nuclease of predicted toxin-antitoxin system